MLGASLITAAETTTMPWPTLSEAIRRSWNDCRGFYIRARIYCQRNAYDSALNDLNAAIRSNPKAEAAFRLCGPGRSTDGPARQGPGGELAGHRPPRPEA